MAHTRSIGEQVRSGFIIAGELVAGFLVFVVATVSLRWLIAPPIAARPVDYLVPLLALTVAAGIMFATAERWGAFILGFLFFRGALKGIGRTVLPSHQIGRTQAALIAIYCITVITML